jgi:two-component system, OmpR family, response regulator
MDKTNARIPPPTAVRIHSSQSHWPASGTESHRLKRVLVVDDEAGITRLLKLNLEQTNEFVVRTENHGDAALAAMTEFAPDLILLDVMMPGIGGDELAPMFRARARGRPIKIVFLTALASKGESYSGPDRILSKPVDLEQVLHCIRHELAA